MNPIDQIIARYASREAVKMGVLNAFPKEQMCADLLKVLHQNRTCFNVLFGSLIGMMALIVGLLMYFIPRPAAASGILAVSGISLPFVIRVLLQMWQVKAQAEMLITLSTNLEPAMVRRLVKILAQNIQVKTFTPSQLRSEPRT